MKSIRVRLILSHILPLLLIAPLLAVTVTYLLRAQRELTAVSTELGQQAQQIARWSHNQPEVWQDTTVAQLFVIEVVSRELPDRSRVDVMLIRPEGYLMAATDPGALDRVGQPVELPEMRLVLSEQDGYLTLRAEVANLYVPVMRDQQMVGLVNMSQELDAVTAGVLRLRYLLIAALVLEILLGIGLGLWLALRFERRLAVVTTAVSRLDREGFDNEPPHLLPETGPREFQSLFRAYNGLVERLQELEESRRKLLANTVHELGRPLGALRSAIQALQVGGDADPQFRQELLQGMDAQVARLQPLLNNLVELHGQALGKIELDRQPTPLAEWLREVAALWQAAAQEKGLQWQADLPESLPTLDVDPNRLAQAAGNLLSNGIKYTPPGGAVRLAASNGGGAVRITVEDSGPGIPEAEFEQIFQPLYRGNGSTRFPQGMGLGLSIARELVRAHGGRLELASEPGQGSRFTIVLPVNGALPGGQNGLQ